MVSASVGLVAGSLLFVRRSPLDPLPSAVQMRSMPSSEMVYMRPRPWVAPIRSGTTCPPPVAGLLLCGVKRTVGLLELASVTEWS